ncbi:MepB family protein [Staphylococcus sp. GSSP0090]|nr:MepB family protein [Staphylococcus sp. GSSP0090]
MYKSINLISSLFNALDINALNDLTYEAYNSEYESYCFQVNHCSYRHRLAKKTPTKAGYFVVFWTKDHENKNRPFTYQETKDILIITVLDHLHKGLFIMPKSELHAQRLLNSENNKGKMAMRVYPPWEDNLNRSAKQAQKWQTQYFIDLSNTTDFDLLKKLLCIED